MVRKTYSPEQIINKLREAEVPDGIPEQVIRIVSENARTLKFESFGFEDS